VRYRSVISAALAAWLVLAWADGPATGKLSQSEAESRLELLKKEITGLKQDLERARKTYSDEQKALKTADLEIQVNSLELRKLASTRKEHEAELSRLHTERGDYLHSLDQRREVLAMQIMAAYRLGQESRLKLVLNQDSPALLSRMLAYYDYFSRSQAKQIKELRQVLQTLDLMQAGINTELSTLVDVQKSQQTVLDELTSQRDKRQAILVRLSNRIGSDEARLAELQKNRQDLEALLGKLSNVLADIPADLGKRLGPAELKGQLPMPVKGRVRHAFGHNRTAGLNWRGWLISADGGSEVKSVAHGRVAFSDWLRGYGLLMIIDHGDGYMSLYGNNESLLHDVGDWVEARTAISTVGSIPGSGSGLYFEFRKNGKAVDPANWVRR